MGRILIYNKSMKKWILLLVTLCPVCAFAVPDEETLTLRETVGQTIMPRVVIGKHRAFKYPVMNGEVTGFFIKAHEGNVTHPVITAKNQDKFIKKQRQKLLKTIKDLNAWTAASKHKIPLFLGIDYEGGTVTSPMYLGLKQMPSNMLLAATQNPQLVAAMYAEQAKEIKRVGANLALGPVADVNSNPKNPIIQTRSFGDDSRQVGRYAAWAVMGLQNEGVPAVLKHFPGHGDTSTDSHYTQPVTMLEPVALWRTHTRAFMPSIIAGAAGVMTNHVAYPTLDAQNSAIFSQKITSELLRAYMGFDGIIFTDGLDMGGINGKPVQEVVLDGYFAGNDVLLLTGKAAEIKMSAVYPHLAGMWVEENVKTAAPKISEKELRARVGKILELKQMMAAQVMQETDEETFWKISRQAAEEGVTLVRDFQQLIPLPKDKTVCAVMFADGIFSKQVKNFADTLAANGQTVYFQLVSRSPAPADFAKLEKCRQKAAVLVVGSSRAGGMDKEQERQVNLLLNEAAADGQPAGLISLLNPYEIPSYPQAKTVLALYGPTMDTTAVAAEILLGLREAKGVLPIKLD